MQMKHDDTEATTKLKLLRRISASVSIAAGGVVRVMFILMNVMLAAISTSQDMKWTLLPWSVPSNYGPLSSRGKQYVVHRYSQVFQMEAHDPPKLIATISRDKLSGLFYLVECDSEVLVVGHNDIMSLTHLAVHRLTDLASGRYVPLKSIGDKAIFVGGRKLCVSSPPRHCLPLRATPSCIAIHGSYTLRGTASVATPGR
jgi:hypothetical protein